MTAPASIPALIAEGRRLIAAATPGPLRAKQHSRMTPLIERFTSRVIPEPMSGCHLWIGGTKGDGYGRICANGQYVGAHVLAWTMRHGPIADGLWVLHKCDNVACVNPDHLFLGTHTDNQRDCVRKGRTYAQKKRVCKHGHALSGENLKIKNGFRTCVACQRAYEAKAYEKRRMRNRAALDAALSKLRGVRT